MRKNWSFHPEALGEFQSSAAFYSKKATPAIAEAFVTVVEKSIDEILGAPKRWQVVGKPQIRRFVCRRFPFVLYYRLQDDRVVIYAVMHSSRRPGYWKGRLA